MVVGINWYSAFEKPQQDSQGRWWIARDGQLGRLLGGHCVALKQRYASDYSSWWEYYDQGQEGRCTQFGVSRMMTLLNRKQYEVRDSAKLGHWLYYESQMADEWPGGSYPGANPVYEGTSVRATLDVVKEKGIVPKGKYGPWIEEGISAYRWVRSMDDMLEVLGYSGLDFVDFLNSWGTYYPHIVRMPVSVMERLWKEDGEIGVPTDR
jgi:hypothetical protein